MATDNTSGSMKRDRISALLKDCIESASYSNLDSLLSDRSVSSIESEVLRGGIPPESIRTALEVLRSDFALDYDDLVFAGEWVGRLPQMITRNYLLRHFLILGNGLGDGNYFHDATLNSAADDYTGFIDLIVVKVQVLGEERHYQFMEEDLPEVELWLRAVITLMHYCRDMLDMSSTLRPSLFQRRAVRMRGRISSVVEMSTLGMDCPGVESTLAEMSKAVDDLVRDEKMRDLQKARNERYKQSKMRLYNYTIRVTEELNNQIEACDPLDLTHRADLRKQLEQVQIFMRSFDKDR